MGRSWIGGLMIVSLLLLSGIVSASEFGPFSARRCRVSAANKPAVMSIFQAYQIAKVEAHKWDPHARLYHIISVDVAGNTDDQQGLEGLRTKWNFDFAVPGTERHLGMYVVAGAAKGVTEFQNPVKWSGYDSLPTLPIGKILKAVEEQGVCPGKNAAFGYHFRLLHVDENRAECVKDFETQWVISSGQVWGSNSSVG